MQNYKSFAFLCISVLAVTRAGKVTFIEPCHWDDANCILQSSKKVLPHVAAGVLDIPALDPLDLNDIDGDNGDLKLKFKKLIVTGLSKCNLLKIERPEKLKLSLALECPISANGQYSVGGKFFVLDVFGNGDFEVKTDKVHIEVTVDIIAVNGEDDKVYYQLGDYEYKYDFVDKCHFKFDNLFDGDQTKAQPVMTILEESWKDVMNTIGKPIIDKVIQNIIKNVAKLFKVVPADELELA